MRKNEEVIMEIAYALMDLYSGLDLVDAMSAAKYQNITLSHSSLTK